MFDVLQISLFSLNYVYSINLLFVAVIFFPFDLVYLFLTFTDGRPASHLQSRRKHASASWCIFYPNENLNRSRHDYKWHEQIKMSRYIVAKSEIAGTGCSDAAHQLSGSS